MIQRRVERTLLCCVGCALSLWACRSAVEVVAHGTGGEGGTTLPTSTTTGSGTPSGAPTGTSTVTVSSTSSTSSTTTGAGTPTGTAAGTPTTCDEGDCVECVNSDCAYQLCEEIFYACADNPDCVSLNECWNTCYDECGGLPDPASCHQTCQWDCNDQFPDGVGEQIAVYACIVCGACPLDCSADVSAYCAQD